MYVRGVPPGFVVARRFPHERTGRNTDFAWSRPQPGEGVHPMRRRRQGVGSPDRPPPAHVDGCGPVGSATPPGRPHRRRRARRGCCGDARDAAGLRRDRVLVPGVCFRDRVANGALPTTVDFEDADGQGSTRPKAAENESFPRRSSVSARGGTTRGRPVWFSLQCVETAFLKAFQC